MLSWKKRRNFILRDFTVTIEKLVYGGDGLARLDGRVVLAPFVLPQEHVRLQAEVEKPGLVRASVHELLTPSPARQRAPCPYFERCGGCHYQHAPHELQLQIKRSILLEELRRIGKIEPPADIAIVSAEPWHYRNRVQLHLQDRRIGFREGRSHELCAIDHCPIASPRLNETIAILRGMLHDARWPHFLKSLELFTNESEVQLNVLETARPVARRFFEWCAERIPSLAPGALDYPVGGDRLRVSGGSFFQVNRYLIEQLVETALSSERGTSATDVYAGVGLFSMAMARRFESVTAVESGSAAMRDLRFNAERAGLTVAAVQRSAEEYLRNLPAAPEFMLFDPPRAGLGKAVVVEVARLRPRRLAIVSCDPATLARDLAGLVAAGYRIERMTLVDLFPQTYHFETVVHLAAQ